VRRSKWLLLAAALVAITAFAAGCGGGGGEATPPPPAETGAAGGNTGATEPAASGPQILRMIFGAEPPSLDPGLATDTTSSNILLNIMDPLVKLGDDLQPVPSLAESWDTSADGKTVTFHLRQDGKWTNGDPVTAPDFVYSWKRTISPELAADYAYQFYGIVGAADYNGCDPKKDDCAALADKVGVKAVDDYTLEVQLTSPQPWFVQQVSHHSFLAVNQKAVEQFGDKWTQPENIVTDGPFELNRWVHDSEIGLVKWDGWRDAADVALTRVDGRIIVDGTTAIQAFEAGETDACDTGCIPPAETPRLKETPEYEVYPALGTYYYGLNVKNVTDVNQRRAMAMAIDRQSIIDNIAQADQIPATGFSPQGLPGFDTFDPKSQWLPPNGDIEGAKALMAKAQSPKTAVNVFANDAPGNKEIAIAIQANWDDIGIKSTIKIQEWAQFLEFLGPPPNDSVDAYRNGWIGDYVDAINFLELNTCDSGNNNTNWCNKDYDALLAKARQTPDNDARYAIYGRLESIMFGPDGEMPIIPIYWYTYNNIERLSIKDTLNFNLLDQVDFTKVVVEQS
jgi:ABC-type oligopeptide transport system substrate-binding subunit